MLNQILAFYAFVKDGYPSRVHENEIYAAMEAVNKLLSLTGTLKANMIMSAMVQFVRTESLPVVNVDSEGSIELQLAPHGLPECTQRWVTIID